MTSIARRYRCQTNHHDAHWPEISKGLKCVPVSKYTAFTPLESSVTRLVLCINRPFISKILNGIASSVQIAIEKDRGKSVPYRVHQVSMQEAINLALKMFDPEQEEGAKVLAETGASKEDYLKCLERAAEIALGYFSKEGDPIFPSSSTRSDLQNWADRSMSRLTLESWNNLDIQFVGPVEYTDEQLKVFGISKKNEIFPASDLSCFDFALLLANEVQAKDLIFRKITTEIDPLKKLEEWGWRAVDAPCEGDIVAYLDDDGNWTHCGYYSGEEGLVHSKFGNNTPYSYKHKLFDVSPYYGNKIIFFRKSKNPVFNPVELAKEARSLSKSKASSKGNTAGYDPAFVSDFEKELEKLESKKVKPKKK